MMKKILENGTYTGERALFMSKDIHFLSCVFEDGESPLKESRDIDLDNTDMLRLSSAGSRTSTSSPKYSTS